METHTTMSLGESLTTEDVAVECAVVIAEATIIMVKKEATTRSPYPTTTENNVVAEEAENSVEVVAVARATTKIADMAAQDPMAVTTCTQETITTMTIAKVVDITTKRRFPTMAAIEVCADPEVTTEAAAEVDTTVAIITTEALTSMIAVTEDLTIAVATMTKERCVPRLSMARHVVVVPCEDVVTCRCVVADAEIWETVAVVAASEEAKTWKNDQLVTKNLTTTMSESEVGPISRLRGQRG